MEDSVAAVCSIVGGCTVAGEDDSGEWSFTKLTGDGINLATETAVDLSTLERGLFSRLFISL